MTRGIMGAVLICCCLESPCWAAKTIFPQIVVGAGWKTFLTATNKALTAQDVKIRVHGSGTSVAQPLPPFGFVVNGQEKCGWSCGPDDGLILLALAKEETRTFVFDSTLFAQPGIVVVDADASVLLTLRYEGRFQDGRIFESIGIITRWDILHNH